MFAAAPAFASDRPQIIKQFPLDERTVYEIPIGRDVPTTLMFPSAITAIEGANAPITAPSANTASATRYALRAPTRRSIEAQFAPPSREATT